ncbi:MAG TPA: (2Fe-2S)-binding protein [Pseudonocardia sp.]|jgi:bacterioferritin-associated ferredoxin
MFVCMCIAVTEDEVRACVHAGARSVEDISRGTEACTGCGGCRESIQALLAETSLVNSTRMCA